MATEAKEEKNLSQKLEEKKINKVKENHQTDKMTLKQTDKSSDTTG